MYIVRAIEDRREWEAVYYRLRGAGAPIPDVLLNADCGHVKAIGMEEKNRFVGLILGITQDHDSNFYLHYFGIAKSATDEKSLRSFAEGICTCVKNTYGCKKIIINSAQTDDSQPFFYGIFEKAGNTGLIESAVFTQIQIKTSDFDHFRQYKWYRPDLMEKKGYEAVKWTEISDSVKEKLIEKEKTGDLPEGYLSPGFLDHSWSYDADSSFALVDKKDNRMIGWIITERIDEKSVKIRRFYIEKNKRSLLLGPSFSTWVLDYINRNFDMLLFDIQKGNRQMEMFVWTYCKPIIYQVRYVSHLKICIQ